MDSGTHDTRMCIACPTRVARGKLLSALRFSGIKGNVRVSPALDEGARNNKRAALRFAHSRGLKVIDRGDFVGFGSEFGRIPPYPQLIDVHLTCADFGARLYTYG